MSKNGKADARRAQKKMAQDKKRAKAAQETRQRKAAQAILAKRREENPLYGWKPESEGLPGLAARLGVPEAHVAMQIACIAERGDAVPESFVSMFDLAEEPVEDIFARLAELGIQTSEGDIRTLVGTETTLWPVFERAWGPLLAEGSVAGRDYAMQAGLVLAEVLVPEHVFEERALRKYYAWEAYGNEHDHEAAGPAALQFLSDALVLFDGAGNTLTALIERLGLPSRASSLYPMLVHDLLIACSESASLAEECLPIVRRLVEAVGGETPEVLAGLEGLRGAVMFGAGQDEAAEAHLRDVIGRYPSEGPPYLYLAEGLAGAQDDEARLRRAVEVLDDGIQRSPASRETLKQLRSVLAALADARATAT